MNIISWNCRGIGNPQAECVLQDLVRTAKPQCVFLIETKCTSARIIKLKSLLGFDQMFVVDCNSRSGGLAFLWNNNITIRLLGYSSRHVVVGVKYNNLEEIQLISF